VHLQRSPHEAGKKVKIALDVTRMLVVGAQILLGFHNCNRDGVSNIQRAVFILETERIQTRERKAAELVSRHADVGVKA